MQMVFIEESTWLRSVRHDAVQHYADGVDTVLLSLSYAVSGTWNSIMQAQLEKLQPIALGAYFLLADTAGEEHAFNLLSNVDSSVIIGEDIVKASILRGSEYSIN